MLPKPLSSGSWIYIQQAFTVSKKTPMPRFVPQPLLKADSGRGQRAVCAVLTVYLRNGWILHSVHLPCSSCCSKKGVRSDSTILPSICNQYQTTDLYSDEGGVLRLNHTAFLSAINTRTKIEYTFYSDERDNWRMFHLHYPAFYLQSTSHRSLFFNTQSTVKVISGRLSSVGPGLQVQPGSLCERSNTNHYAMEEPRHSEWWGRHAARVCSA